MKNIKITFTRRVPVEETCRAEITVPDDYTKDDVLDAIDNREFRKIVITARQYDDTNMIVSVRD